MQLVQVVVGLPTGLLGAILTFLCIPEIVKWLANKKWLRWISETLAVRWLIGGKSTTIEPQPCLQPRPEPNPTRSTKKTPRPNRLPTSNTNNCTNPGTQKLAADIGNLTHHAPPSPTLPTFVSSTPDEPLTSPLHQRPLPPLPDRKSHLGRPPSMPVVHELDANPYARPRPLSAFRTFVRNSIVGPPQQPVVEERVAQPEMVFWPRAAQTRVEEERARRAGW
jgi:hypothetical protein